MPAELTSSVQAPGHRVFHVQHGAEGVADRLAILDGDLGAIGAVRHDLHGGPVAAEHGDAHQFVAHAFQCGSNDGGQPRFEAGMWGVRCVQNEKGGRLRPPSVTLRKIDLTGQIEPRAGVCKVEDGSAG